MITASRRLAVVDEIDRISSAGVFRDALVVKLRPMRVRIDDYIFKDAAETDGVPDLRLALLRQTNGFGIATAFEVEHALIGPAVLVVANEPPFRVGRQGRLAG